MKLKTILVTLFLTLLIAKAKAENDTIILKSEIYSEKISEDLDSLVNSWYVKIAMQGIKTDFNFDSTGIEYPDTV